MRRSHFIAFDDVITGTSTVYTSAAPMGTMAMGTMAMGTMATSTIRKPR